MPYDKRSRADRDRVLGRLRTYWPDGAPKRAVDQFIAVYNSVYEATHDEGRSLAAGYSTVRRNFGTDLDHAALAGSVKALGRVLALSMGRKALRDLDAALASCDCGKEHNETLQAIRYGIKLLQGTPNRGELLEHARSEYETRQVGVNTAEVWDMIASGIYKQGDKVFLAVREMLQNSRDAGAKNIQIEWRASPDPLPDGRKTATLTFTDDGRGMTRKIVEDKFFSLGDSFKGEGALGGFGAAKAVILTASATGWEWDLRTRRVHAQSEASGFYRITDVTEDFPGTRLTLYHVLDQELDAPIGSGTPVERIGALLAACDLRGLKVTVNGAEYESYFEGRRGKTEEAFEGLDWGRATVKIKSYKRPSGEGGVILVRVKGLAQFAKGQPYGGKFARDYVLDFEIPPDVRPKSPEYPFTPGRDDFQRYTEAKRSYDILRDKITMSAGEIDRESEYEEIQPDSTDPRERKAEAQFANMMDTVIGSKGFTDVLADMGDLAREMNDAIYEALGKGAPRADEDDESVRPGGWGQTDYVPSPDVSPFAEFRTLLSGAHHIEEVLDLLGTWANDRLPATNLSGFDYAVNRLRYGSGTAEDLETLSGTIMEALNNSAGNVSKLELAAYLSKLLDRLTDRVRPDEQEEVVRKKKRGELNPFGGAAVVFISRANYGPERGKEFRKKSRHFMRHLVWWDVTVRAVVQALQAAGRLSPSIHPGVGFVLDDKVLGLTRRDGKYVMINPEALDKVVEQFKDRPFIAASFIHGVACHELAHSQQMIQEYNNGHNEYWSVKRESFASDTLFLLPVIEDAGAKLLKMRRRRKRTPTVQELDRKTLNQVAELEQALGEAREKIADLETASRELPLPLVKLGRQLDDLIQLEGFRTWVRVNPGLLPDGTSLEQLLDVLRSPNGMTEMLSLVRERSSDAKMEVLHLLDPPEAFEAESSFHAACSCALRGNAASRKDVEDLCPPIGRYRVVVGGEGRIHHGDGTTSGPIRRTTRELQRRWEKTAEAAGDVLWKHGVKLGKLLGCGSYACAFAVKGRPNLVAKITGDPADAGAWAHVLNVSKGRSWPAGLVRTYCVEALPEHRGRRMFFMLQDRVNRAVDADSPEGMFLDDEENRQAFLHGDRAALLGDIREYGGPKSWVDPLLKTIQWLHEHKIEWGDLHSGNVMLRNRRPVIIDLGHGSVPTTKVRVMKEAALRLDEPYAYAFGREAEAESESDHAASRVPTPAGHLSNLLAQAGQEAGIPPMDELNGSAARMHDVLSLLVALFLLYEDLHWRYQHQYGDHLVFQRLYTAIQPEFDAFAEKLVGYHGAEALGLPAVLSRARDYVAAWQSESSDPIDQGLAAEQSLQGALRETYEDLKGRGDLPLGLDDWLMATANAHETNIYLLQQLRGGPPRGPGGSGTTRSSHMASGVDESKPPPPLDAYLHVLWEHEGAQVALWAAARCLQWAIDERFASEPQHLEITERVIAAARKVALSREPASLRDDMMGLSTEVEEVVAPFQDHFAEWYPELVSTYVDTEDEPEVVSTANAAALLWADLSVASAIERYTDGLARRNTHVQQQAFTDLYQGIYFDLELLWHNGDQIATITGGVEYRDLAAQLRETRRNELSRLIQHELAPARLPTAHELHSAPEAVQVAWDYAESKGWISGSPQGSVLDAARRAAGCGCAWSNPVVRALAWRLTDEQANTISSLAHAKSHAASRRWLALGQSPETLIGAIAAGDFPGALWVVTRLLTSKLRFSTGDTYIREVIDQVLHCVHRGRDAAALPNLEALIQEGRVRVEEAEYNYAELFAEEAQLQQEPFSEAQWPAALNQWRLVQAAHYCARAAVEYLRDNPEVGVRSLRLAVVALNRVDEPESHYDFHLDWTYPDRVAHELRRSDQLVADLVAEVTPVALAEATQARAAPQNVQVALDWLTERSWDPGDRKGDLSDAVRRAANFGLDWNNRASRFLAEHLTEAELARAMPILSAPASRVAMSRTTRPSGLPPQDERRARIREAAIRGERGRFWYQEAQHQIETVARAWGVSPYYVAVAVAATSPATPVIASQRMARGGGSASNLGKARRVIKAQVLRGRGSEALHEDTPGLSLLRVFEDCQATGKSPPECLEVAFPKPDRVKTHSFVRNLLGYADPVTVDTLISRGVAGETIRVTEARHKAIADDIKAVAAELGWEPREVMAAAWTAWGGSGDLGLGTVAEHRAQSPRKGPRGSPHAKLSAWAAGEDYEGFAEEDDDDQFFADLIGG